MAGETFVLLCCVQIVSYFAITVALLIQGCQATAPVTNTPPAYGGATFGGSTPMGSGGADGGSAHVSYGGDAVVPVIVTVPAGSGGAVPVDNATCKNAVARLAQLECPVPGFAANCPSLPVVMPMCISHARTCVESRNCGAF